MYWTELLITIQSAVIQEGLRLSSIVTTRLPRIAPDEVLEYMQWQIPAGVCEARYMELLVRRRYLLGRSNSQTPVSMSTYFILRDPEIFPEPEEFRPERWLLDPDDLKRLQRFLVPSSKGTAGCLGQK